MILRSVAIFMVLYGVLVSLPISAAPETLDRWFEKRQSWLVEQQLIKPQEKPKHINRLIMQDSPYLLSHALQAIDWYAWTDQPFEVAKAQNKLIYLSIGYETCHWCHVLAHESYEDPHFAALLNSAFVNIKLDRERYPEVDQKYHRALASMMPDPGWPIQVVLTPDKNIVWIASYMPRDTLQATLSTLAKKWSVAPEAITAYAAMQQQQLLPPAPSGLGRVSLTYIQNKQQQSTEAIRSLLKHEQSGQGPRFLRANWLLVLLDEYATNKMSSDLSLVKTQLRQLLSSPSYDFIDGGMHRYAEDGNWLRPHFEKMLYDQANLIRVLTRIYGITGESQYLDFAEQIVDFVAQFLIQDIGYASSLSALSAGIEGDYYTISPESIDSAVAEQNKVEMTQSLLHLSQVMLPPKDEIATFQQLRLAKALPKVDGKSVLSWNALYLLSLTELFQVTNKQNVELLIRDLAQDIMQGFYRHKTLNRIVFQGKASISATVEDYAWLIIAFEQLHWTLEDDNYVAFIENIAGAFIEALTLTDWANLQLDSELPSSAGVSMYALQVLAEYHSANTYQAALDLLKTKIDFASLKLDAASLIYAWNKQALSSAKVIQGFAKGKGLAKVHFSNGNGQIQIILKPGWHINSDQPNDKSLIATTLSLVNSSGALTVNYPPPSEKKLGISQTVMSLYENTVVIPFSISQDKFDKGVLSLTLQACSNKVCLMPETLSLLY